MKTKKIRRITLIAALVMIIACVLTFCLVGPMSSASASSFNTGSPNITTYAFYDGDYSGNTQTNDVPVTSMATIIIKYTGTRTTHSDGTPQFSGGVVLSVKQYKRCTDTFAYNGGTYRIESDTQTKVNTSYVLGGNPNTTSTLNSRIGYGTVLYKNVNDSTFTARQNIFSNPAQDSDYTISGTGLFKGSLYFEYNNTKLFGYKIWNCRLDFSFYVV